MDAPSRNVPREEEPNRRAKCDGCPKACATKTMPFQASTSRESILMLSNFGGGAGEGFVGAAFDCWEGTGSGPRRNPINNDTTAANLTGRRTSKRKVYPTK